MRVALVAGETSGDLLGAGLIRALRKRNPDISFEGVAGPEMEAAGCKVLEQAEALAVFGLIEPLARIPGLLRLRGSLVRRWTEEPPDVFVGIDAPDFNLGLETRLRARGIRTVQYVSPSVWAWRRRRIRKIEKAVDKVLCLLPFEKSYYDEHDIAADFVGHPMADNTLLNPDIDSIRSALGIRARTVIAVLPGSRHSEVSRLGPVFAETCARLARENAELGFVAPMATASLRTLFSAHLDDAGMADSFVLTDGDSEKAMACADLVLLASGTASLQAALLGRPMVAAYRLSALTYAIARAFNLVKVRHFTLPNLLTDEPLVPEFLQDAANPRTLAAALSELLSDADRRALITERFSVLRSELAQGADERAADAVLELANRS